MLSRVAERVYWFGRYMERLENTARLILVNSNLLLDLPKGVQLGWFILVDITGATPQFRKKALKEEEQPIIRFLLADQSNPVSIMSSLAFARENARTTREIIPAEAWELINNLYFHAKEHASKSVSRASRTVFLRRIIDVAQRLTGMLAGTMSHTSVYDFIRLGRNLERADMTTRIVDVGAVNLITNIKRKAVPEEAVEPFSDILWMNVLNSLSAYQMYRQHVQERVNGKDVVDFLLKDTQFPRSVVHCLTQVGLCIGELPQRDDALREVAAMQRLVDGLTVEELLNNDALHDCIDELQLIIAQIHQAIAETWFLRGETASA